MEIKRIIAALATVICLSASATEPLTECEIAYDEIKRGLEKNIISLQQAQKLWLEHKRSHGETETITGGSGS